MNIIQPMVFTVLALLMCSCATIKPPRNVAFHELLPEKFELHNLPSPLFGGGSDLVFENGYLARHQYEGKWVRGGQKNVLIKTEYFVPSELQWRDFWKEMDKIQVWSWKKRYDPSDIGVIVNDGGGWHLIISYNGMMIDTGGENAGPEPGNPKKTTVGWEWDKQIQDAVSILTAKKG